MTAAAGGRNQLDRAVLVSGLALAVLGRFGPVWLAARPALRERRQPYRYPEGRPLVG